MSRQTLKDRNNHVLGYIDVESSGLQCLRNSNFHVIGYYDPGRNLLYTYQLALRTPRIWPL